MTDKQIEKLFVKWYDSRNGMPPASWESFKAGYDAAMIARLVEQSSSKVGG